METQSACCTACGFSTASPKASERFFSICRYAFVSLRVVAVRLMFNSFIFLLLIFLAIWFAIRLWHFIRFVVRIRRSIKDFHKQQPNETNSFRQSKSPFSQTPIEKDISDRVRIIKESKDHD